MGYRILSARGGRVAAQRPSTYLLWISVKQAIQFREPGWEPLMPPRNGGVLFLNKARRDALGLAVDGGAEAKESWAPKAAVAARTASARVPRPA
jgi:hypothetical protein